MRISDWSSDVCSSDLPDPGSVGRGHEPLPRFARGDRSPDRPLRCGSPCGEYSMKKFPFPAAAAALFLAVPLAACGGGAEGEDKHEERSEERRVGKECVGTCRSRGSPDH